MAPSAADLPCLLRQEYTWSDFLFLNDLNAYECNCWYYKVYTSSQIEEKNYYYKRWRVIIRKDALMAKMEQ